MKPRDVKWTRSRKMRNGRTTPCSRSATPRCRSKRSSSCSHAYGIRRLADVRTVPRSRRNPQFNADALASALRAQTIEYVPLPALGGLRHARKDSPNTGWRNESFRGYADYMQTPAFEDGLDALIRMSREMRTAIMCAEAVPWRCHRSLVADALEVRGIPVVEILSRAKRAPAQAHAVRARRRNHDHLPAGADGPVVAGAPELEVARQPAGRPGRARRHEHRLRCGRGPGTSARGSQPWGCR